MSESKENDLLEIEEDLQLETSPSHIIENLPVESDEVPYNEFFKKYLYRNRPCILQVTETKNWKSVNEWIVESKPNFTYICEKFGKLRETRIL